MNRSAIGEPNRRDYLVLILISCLLTLTASTATATPSPRSRAPAPSESQAGNQQPVPPVARELVPGASVEQKLEGGETRAYSVALSEGQYVEVSVRQEGIDVAVSAFAPDGGKLAEVDNDPSDGVEYVVAVAGAAART